LLQLVLIYVVKPVYKGHCMEPENMSFIYMLKLSLNGENETAIYRQ